MDEEELKDKLMREMMLHPELKEDFIKMGAKFILRMIYFAAFFFLLGLIIGKLL